VTGQRTALPRPIGRGVAATLTVVALLATGCGSGDDGTDGSAPRGDVGGGPSPKVVVQTAESGFNAVGVYRQTAPGVITVRSLFGGSGGLFGDNPSGAEGSGFVLNADGEIITNAHVVTTGSGAERSEADQVFVEFPDRNVVSAEIVGFDPFYDVALLKVDPEGIDLKPLPLGDDSKLVVGQPVAAIGSPFGEQQSLSVGVVSATDRSVRSLTQFQIEGAIQTDASINPGNSGGPLLDGEGQVIGINQQIETQSGANDGVGFAVPISAIMRSVSQLREKGEVSYAYIGVSSQPLYPQLAEELGIDSPYGGLIATVEPGSPAEDAGLRGADEGADGRLRFQARPYRTGGDVIVRVEGRPVVAPDDLARIISSYAPGDEIQVEVIRDGERREVTITLGERPSSISGG
jgi:S1-C subfamily serine protease